MFRKLFVVFQEYVVVFALVGHRTKQLSLNSSLTCLRHVLIKNELLKLQLKNCSRKFSSAQGFGAFGSQGEHRLFVCRCCNLDRFAWRSCIVVSSGRKVLNLYCIVHLYCIVVSCTVSSGRKFVYLCFCHRSMSLERRV